MAATRLSVVSNEVQIKAEGGVLAEGSPKSRDEGRAGDFLVNSLILSHYFPLLIGYIPVFPSPI